MDRESKILNDAAKEGFVVPGTKKSVDDAVASFNVDMLIRMVADRIRAGEDPEEAAKSVLDLAKEFADADEVIFDDDKNVKVEELEEDGD